MRPHKVYPIEYRKELVGKIDTGELTLKEALEQGVPTGTLYSWIYRYGKDSRLRLVERRERLGHKRKKRTNGHATVRVTQTGPEDGGTVSSPELIMAYRQAAATLLRAGFNKEFLISLT